MAKLQFSSGLQGGRILIVEDESILSIWMVSCRLILSTPWSRDKYPM